MAKIKTSLFEAVHPRGDVLEGHLADAIFAANLDEVVLGTAPAVYGNPATFFAGTHPSAGLRTLLNEVLARVGGKTTDAPSVIRLETNLGGGKTHNLIALYHAARGDLASERRPEFMTPSLYPDAPVEQIGVFVGTSAGATSFPEVDGVAARTLWGYLALQLGGRDIYSYVREDDETTTAPGSDALRDVLRGRPTLLLIDELARYLETASGVTVGTTTLARQTVSFLMALMEAVDAQPRASLVVTTTGVTDAFGDSTQAVLDAMAEARALMARREHVLRPSEEADLPRILSRRLFDSVDPKAGQSVSEAYRNMVDEAVKRGIDLPDAMRDPRWIAELEAAYPFHPALLRVLDKRLSTIPNFQRTRGALRLLARVTRALWERRPEDADLIRLDYVNLGEREIAEDLSSRLDRATLEPVIRVDVCSQVGGEPSHAELVDQDMGSDYVSWQAVATCACSSAPS
jgi:predicted AAA+ superfamily ATPase